MKLKLNTGVNRDLLVFIAVSALFLISISIISPAFRRADIETSRVRAIDRESVNLPFYRKTAEQLKSVFERLSAASVARSNSMEFATQLPKAASRFGIRDISIENLGAQNDNGREITEIRISAFGNFRQIVAFLDELENGVLPVQVKNLLMREENGRVRALFVLRLVRTIPEVK